MGPYPKQLVLLLLLGITLSATAQENYINSGNAALKAGSYEEALSQYQLAEEHCDEDIAYANNTAVLSALQDDPTAALSVLAAAIDKDKDNPQLLYNRAVLHLNAGDYRSALQDLALAEAAGQKKGSKVKKGAGVLQAKFNDRQVLATVGMAEEALDEGSHKEALLHYEAALEIKPSENALLFGKAQAALGMKNPIESLAAMEAVDLSTLTAEQKKDFTLVKAYSLGRINRMKEAIKILERVVANSNSPELKAKELLGFYYLRLSQYDKTIDILKYEIYDTANPYVVAGNAALYSKKYSIALKCFQNALILDKFHLDAQIGLALSQAQMYDRLSAKQLIDSLSQRHPDNHYVLNAKGIIHKDIGLHYKNSYNGSRAQSYFASSAVAFQEAGKINEHLLESFSSNRALSLFFNDKKETASEIWRTLKKMGSQNNLALAAVSDRNYRRASNLLDSLSADYYNKNRRRNGVLEHNRRLARNQSRLNDNYKFVTYYFLHQDTPEIEMQSSFPEYALDQNSVVKLSDFQLIYSDKDCKEPKSNSTRKKRKRKRLRLGKRKKKKFEGQCPKFD